MTDAEAAHRWYWRRRRNQTWGHWECIICGYRTEPVGLDPYGRPAGEPPELPCLEARRSPEVERLRRALSAYRSALRSGEHESEHLRRMGDEALDG